MTTESVLGHIAWTCTRCNARNFFPIRPHPDSSIVTWNAQAAFTGSCSKCGHEHTWCLHVYASPRPTNRLPDIPSSVSSSWACPLCGETGNIWFLRECTEWDIRDTSGQADCKRCGAKLDLNLNGCLEDEEPRLGPPPLVNCMFCGMRWGRLQDMKACPICGCDDLGFCWY